MSNHSATAAYQVAALYKFTRFDDPVAVQARLRASFQSLPALCGTILIAREGINGTIAAPSDQLDAAVTAIRALPGLNDGLSLKYSTADDKPFLRMKVRLKNEIVTIGDQTVDPNDRVGTYVDPQDWNALVADPEVLLIDCRNDYEVEIGSFEGAVNPNTSSFREFPDYVRANIDKATHKKVAMFCTGGIRCEKASAFMLNEGFDEVFHLNGGILKYLETVPSEQSTWTGDCFVFDSRVAVGHGLAESGLDQCHACRRPIDAAAKADPLYELGVACPKCAHERTDADRERYRSRQKQVELARSRGEEHLG